MSEVAALEGRVTRLENAVTSGFAELKGMMRQEISDLKDEQIKDLKEANKRLADDQRRAWDAIESLRRREDQRAGGDRRIAGIWQFVSGGGVGGLIGWLASWLGGTPPHHP